MWRVACGPGQQRSLGGGLAGSNQISRSWDQSGGSGGRGAVDKAETHISRLFCHMLGDFELGFLFVCFGFLGFFETESLCSFGACPGTHSLDQDGLKLTEIYLLLLPKCWD